jgi:hypothetical protein
MKEENAVKDSIEDMGEASAQDLEVHFCFAAGIYLFREGLVAGSRAGPYMEGFKRILYLVVQSV